MTRFGLFALALALVSTTARAQSEDAQDLLTEGRRLYADLEYEAAEQTLTRALAEDGLPDAFRIELLETLGFVQVVLEREAPARQTFERLFAIDPYYVVREPSGSPRVASLVESVRSRVVSDAAIDPEAQLRVDLPRAARRDGTTEIRVSASTPAVTRIVLQVRGDHDVAFRPIDGTGTGGQFVVEIPRTEDSEELELYVEARDARGRIVTRSGSPLAPLRLPVTGSGPSGGGTSIVEEWWFWTVIGVVVVGAAVGIGVGVGTSGVEQAPSGTLPPGRVVLF